LIFEDSGKAADIPGDVGDSIGSLMLLAIAERARLGDASLAPFDLGALIGWPLGIVLCLGELGL
jgi:hypothetical protein